MVSFSSHPYILTSLHPYNGGLTKIKNTSTFLPDVCRNGSGMEVDVVMEWFFSSPQQLKILVRRIEGGDGPCCYSFPSIQSHGFRGAEGFIDECILGERASLTGCRTALIGDSFRLVSFTFSGNPIAGHEFVCPETLVLRALVPRQLPILQDYILWLARHNSAWIPVARELKFIGSTRPI